MESAEPGQPDAMLLQSLGFEFAAAPALLVSSPDGEVLAANRSARRLLAGVADDPVGTVLGMHASVEDRELLRAELATCTQNPGHVGALRFRFLAADGPGALVEMLVTACDWTHDDRSMVSIQMRDVGSSSSMTTFLRAASDLTDGDALLNALAVGPWGQLPVVSLALFSVHLGEEELRLRASRGWDERRTLMYSVLPLSHHTIVGVCALSSEVAWLTMAEMVERFPLSAPEVRRSAPSLDSVAVCLPLTSRGVSVGVLWVVLESGVTQSLQVWEALLSGVQVLVMWLIAAHPSALQRPPVADARPVRRSSTFVLSERDHEILRLVSLRRTNREIADLLGYSEATIRADLTRMGKFLDVSGRRRILQRARELGLHGE